MRSVYVIILLSFLFFITGCSAPKKKAKFQEFSFYIGNPEAPEIDLSNTAVGTMVMSKTGVKLNTRYIKSSDPATEAAYMISSEDYPDIIYGYTATRDFVSGGALIPLNDLIDKYGPNIKKHYGKKLELFKDEKGIIYYIGPNYQVKQGNYPSSGFRLPIKLLKEFNWPEVRRFDHYIELIKKYVLNHKKENPNLIGFTALTSITGRNTLLLGASFLMGYPNLGDIYFPDMDKPEAHLIIQADFARKYFKILNNLWNEGLLDTELFTQSEEVYYNKIAQGDTVGFFDYENLIYQVAYAMERRGSTEDTPVAFPVLFEGVEKDSYNIIQIQRNIGVGISVQCKDPESVMRFWNRFLEEDIQRYIYWGIERMHYYIKDGKMNKRPTQFRTLYRPEDGTMRFTDGFPGWDQTGTFSDGSVIVPELDPGYTQFVTPKYLRDLNSEYGITSNMDWYSARRKLVFGSGNIFIPAGDPIENIRQELGRLTDFHLEKVIGAKSEDFETAWQQFQEALEAVDVKSYLDYKTAYYRNIRKILE